MTIATITTNPARAIRRNVHHAKNPIVDFLIDNKQLKNDAALARTLGLLPPAISKIRHGVMPVSAEILLRMHDVFGLPVDQLRTIANMPKPVYGASA